MSKGKNFEREVSKNLSLWLTHGENPDTIWYTKSSGGRATRKVANNQMARRYDFGDLGPDDARVFYFFDTFSCELKTGYGKKQKNKITLWSITDIIDSNQNIPIFYDFWSQAMHDAQESEREPLLIFRRNHRLTCIAMRTIVFNVFKSNCNIDFDYINIQLNEINSNVTVCNLSYFFNATWEIINENFIKLKVNRPLILEKYR